MKFRFSYLTLTKLIVAAIMAVPVQSHAEENMVSVYSVPDAMQDCPYELKVDGISVPIEKAGAYQGAYYARFEFEGNVRAQVEVKSSANTKTELKPQRFRVNVNGEKRSKSFDINEPGPRVVTTTCGSKELWPLIILAQKPVKPQELKSDYINAKDYLASSGLQTENIQKALDDCAQRGGGVIYFGPGTYETGPLYIKDNTTVLLAPGCLIRAAADPALFKTSREFNYLDSNCPGAETEALINFYRCKNSKIIGPGVIDGMGHIIREHDKNVRLLEMAGAENIEIRDVVLRNPAFWTVHVLGSQKVSFDEVKIIADWAVGNSDGINPDCSQDVTTTNYFAYTGDDSFAVKSTSNSDKLQGCKNIKLQDSVVMTRKTAFKIGTETFKDTSNILIERCEAINTSRGIGFYIRDGGKASDITCRDINLDLMEYPFEGSSGAPFTAEIAKRSGVGALSDVVFENISAAAPYYSSFRGMQRSRIKNVTFKNCNITITDRTDKTDKLPALSIESCEDFRFVNTKINWSTRFRDIWSGDILEKSSSNIDK